MNEGISSLDKAKFVTLIIVNATKEDLYELKELLDEEILQRVSLEAQEDLRTGN